jgi:hypothetical protein
MEVYVSDFISKNGDVYPLNIHSRLNCPSRVLAVLKKVTSNPGFDNREIFHMIIESQDAPAWKPGIVIHA